MKLKRYLDLSGKSGVVAYALRPDGIVVQFRSAGRYEYTYDSAGVQAIEEMQALAQAGRGLSAYISRHAPPYARKLT